MAKQYAIHWFVDVRIVLLAIHGHGALQMPHMHITWSSHCSPIFEELAQVRALLTDKAAFSRLKDPWPCRRKFTARCFLPADTSQDTAGVLCRAPLLINTAVLMYPTTWQECYFGIRLYFQA